MSENQTDTVTQSALDVYLADFGERLANRIVGDLTEAFVIHFVEPINERIDRLEERFDTFEKKYEAIEALYTLE